MLSFPAAIKVYLCTVACDMRRRFDGLSMMAEHIIRRNPFSGHLLVFCNRRSEGNGAERSLRGVMLGRHNRTFFESDNGGRTAAVLNSLIATCQRQRIDPFAYLRDVFQRISAHPRNRLEELLPDRWAATRASVTS